MLAIYGALIGAAAAIITVFLNRLITRRIRRLGSEVEFAGPIVNFEPEPGGPIDIVVRTDLLGNSEENIEPLTYSSVGRVFGFRIVLKNTGNLPIENQTISFELDDSARVVEIRQEDSSPAIRDRAHNMKGIGGSEASTDILFINPQEELIIGLRSVDNSSDSCAVSAAAPGLSHDNMRTVRRERRVLAMGLAFVLMAAGMALISLSEYVAESRIQFQVGRAVLVTLSYITVVIGPFLYPRKRRGTLRRLFSPRW